MLPTPEGPRLPVIPSIDEHITKVPVSSEVCGFTRVGDRANNCMSAGSPGRPLQGLLGE